MQVNEKFRVNSIAHSYIAYAHIYAADMQLTELLLLPLDFIFSALTTIKTNKAKNNLSVHITKF